MDKHKLYIVFSNIHSKLIKFIISRALLLINKININTMLKFFNIYRSYNSASDFIKNTGAEEITIEVITIKIRDDYYKLSITIKKI